MGITRRGVLAATAGIAGGAVLAGKSTQRGNKKGPARDLVEEDKKSGKFDKKKKK